MSLLLERVRRALAPGLVVERELGAGGMGVVFLARDVALDREVAVKVLRPEAATAAAAERFLREARLMARVRHPHVVSVHGAGEADGLPYLVMDHVSGPTLAARLASGPLTPQEGRRVCVDLLAALAAVHQQGIVHRDLKPANVFLEHGLALLADFGVARTDSTGDETLTVPGREPGTPAYMSPEQQRGEVATPRSDVYAAGMVLYECLTGRRWPALADPGTADWHGVPSGLVRPLQRALALAPADRWPEAGAFAAGLAAGSRRRSVAPALALLAVAAIALALRGGRSPAAEAWSPGDALPRSSAGQAAWRDGERLHRAGRWRDADAAYTAAIAADGGCLACRLRRLELDRWLEEDRDTVDLRLVVEGVGRFAPAWQGLVRSLTARAASRLAVLDSVTIGYRDFAQGWYYLGTERFNRGPLFGVPRRAAIDALEQADRLDPGSAAPRLDLAMALVAEGEGPAAARAVAALDALPRTAGLAEAQRLLVQVAFAYRFGPPGGEGSHPTGDTVWAVLQRDPAMLRLPQAPAGPRVLSGLGTPEGAVDLGRRYEASGSRPLQRSGLYGQAFALVALGRPLAADSAAARLAVAFPGREATAFRAQLAAAVVVLEPGATPEALRQAARDLALLLRPTAPAALRRESAWLSALAAIRLGDTAAARALVSRPGDPAGDRTRALIEATLLATSGDMAAGLRVTDPVVLDLEGWDASETSPFLRAAVKLSRAAWWQRLDEPESALLELRWHQHLHLPDYPVGEAPEPAEGDWAFSTLGLWVLARRLHRRDDEVCAAYRTVATRWRGGEPLYRARSDTAGAALIALDCPP